MLNEFERLRQDKNGFRRLFSDNNCDLYLWYDNKTDKNLVGFQIVYKSNIDLKALTWTKKEGFYHLAVDEGRNRGGQTPLLVLDGLFEYNNVNQTIDENITSIEDNDVKTVLEMIKQYGQKNKDLTTAST